MNGKSQLRLTDCDIKCNIWTVSVIYCCLRLCCHCLMSRLVELFARRCVWSVWHVGCFMCRMNVNAAILDRCWNAHGNEEVNEFFISNMRDTLWDAHLFSNQTTHCMDEFKNFRHIWAMFLVNMCGCHLNVTQFGFFFSYQFLFTN